MKRIVRLIILLTLVLVISVYCLGSLNICLGSNTAMFKSAFDCNGDVWYCEKYNVEATVVRNDKGVYMNLVDLDNQNEYTLVSLNDVCAELYSGHDQLALDSENCLYFTTIQHVKRWFNVTKFIIKNVDSYQWDMKGNDSMIFIRKR